MNVRCAILSLLAGAAVAVAGTGVPLSPEFLAPSPDGRTLYVTARTGRSLLVTRLPAGEVAARIALPDQPTGVAVSRDGKSVAVTVGQAAGQLVLVDAAAARITATIPVGHSPLAPVFAPDGRALFLCNQFLDSVAVVDLQKQAVTARIPAGHQPVASALSPDGSLLLVANLLPQGTADAPDVAATVYAIATEGRKTVAVIQLPDGSTGVRGLCVSPAGDYAYVTHTLGRHRMPATQLDRGWMNTAALSVLSLKPPAWVNTVLLDDLNLGAANPWGIAVTDGGSALAVAHAGTGEISIIPRQRLHQEIDVAAAQTSRPGNYSGSLRDDLAFMQKIGRIRLRAPGAGPRGVAAVGDAVYAAGYFSDSLVRVEATGTAAAIPLGPRVEPDLARRGEIAFHSAQYCYEQWQSCASCHPDNARTDGLNWDLLNDGIGNPKQTKSLLLAHETSPAMSLGVRETAEAAVRAGFKHIQLVTPSEEVCEAVDAYLQSLQPVPSPHLVAGRPSEAARRGQKIFERANCATCHSGPRFTDLAAYAVGTGAGRETGVPFDTPTLIECWRTAPYLHHGRAATIADVLTRFNPGNRHGDTANLSATEINDLAAFVLSQ